MELPTQKIVEILRTVDLCAKTNMTMENSSMNEDIFPIEHGGDFSIVMIVFAGCFLIFADIGSLQLDPLDSFFAHGGRFKTLELCNAAWGISKMSFDAEKDLQAGLPARSTSMPPWIQKQHRHCHHFKNI